jgi:hypothetical protein
MAAVDLIHEQLGSFVGDASRYDIADYGLVVWPIHDPLDCVLYPLGNDQANQLDRLPPGAVVLGDHVGDKLIFSRRPLAWSTWVTTWELDRLADSNRARVLDGVDVLGTTPQ